MYSYVLVAALSIVIGFLSSICILHWAIGKPSAKVLSLYFNKRDGFKFTIKKNVTFKGSEAKIVNDMEVIK